MEVHTRTTIICCMSIDTLRSTVREMSHELRTPLTSIIGFSELLLEEESIVGQQRDYLQTISDEANRLSSMLNHYLSLLSVESGAAE